MRLTDHHLDGRRLHAWGPQAALELTSPAPGVIRLRQAPQNAKSSALHPKLEAKRSWAAAIDGAEALEVSGDGDTIVVTAPGASVELHLPTGTWVFRDGDGESVATSAHVRGDFRAEYPVPMYRSRLALVAPDGEAYLGFGEKVGALDKRGMHLTFWNTDVVPHQPDTDPLYQSIPFFVALRDGRAWGLLLDESWRSEVDVALADPERVEWDVWGPELDVYLIAGPHPNDVLRRYLDVTGRPPMPPLWPFGMQQSRWGYSSEGEIRDVIRGYRERDLGLDVVYLDIDYMDGYKVFTFDPTRYPNPAALARDAREHGVRLITIVDPGVKREAGYPVYEEAAERDYLVRTDRGDVLVGEVWPRPAVFPDFTRDEVQRWWGALHEGFLDIGIAGFWNDMNEPSCFALIDETGNFTSDGQHAAGMGRVEGKTLPYDARHGTRRHLEAHNVYALGMARGTRDGLLELQPSRRPFVLTRAGFAGIQRHSWVWTGDNSSHWTHLEVSIPMIVGLGLSGVAFTGADIPGFVGTSNGELMARWTQLGVFYPLMRNHSAKGTPPQEPWRFGEPWLELARDAIRRRYRLLPTLYSLAREASEDGLPIMRALVTFDPADRECLRAYDQFLFGADVLVAPVTRPEQVRRMAYLPRGRWLEFANLERPGAIVDGGRYVIADAPIDATPAWLREGGAIALTGEAAHTSTANWPSLTWHVHAGPEVRGALFEDEGDGFDGPSRTTTLGGGTSRGAFTLERRVDGTLPFERDEEIVRVYGLNAVKDVSGAVEHRFQDGVLEARVSADWSRLEVRLANGSA